MKKIKPTKLSINTETVRALNEAALCQVVGAATNTCLGTACQCLPTMGNECHTQAYTDCLCTYNSACNRC